MHVHETISSGQIMKRISSWTAPKPRTPPPMNLLAKSTCIAPGASSSIVPAAMALTVETGAPCADQPPVGSLAYWRDIRITPVGSASAENKRWKYAKMQWSLALVTLPPLSNSLLKLMRGSVCLGSLFRPGNVQKKALARMQAAYPQKERKVVVLKRLYKHAFAHTRTNRHTRRQHYRWTNQKARREEPLPVRLR